VSRGTICKSNATLYANRDGPSGQRPGVGGNARRFGQSEAPWSWYALCEINSAGEDIR